MKKALLLSSILASTCAVSSAAVVQFDFDSVPGQGAPVTQAGWTAAAAGNGSNGTVTVATTGVGAITVDGRVRTNNGGGSEADMWADFVFANGSFASVAGSGLSLALSGLTPNTIYPITVWAFDEGSNPAGFDRTADWSGGGGSATLSFPAGPDPATLADYTVSFNALTDGAGALTVTGIVAATNPSTSHNVFINGLEVGDAIPEPSTSLLGMIALGGLALRRRR